MMHAGKKHALSPFLELLGVEVAEAMYPRSRLLLPWRDNLVNPMGTLHGGVIATLVDAAMGCALLSKDEIKGIATMELKLNYIKAVTNGIVKAEGEVIHRSGLMVYGHAYIYCRDNLVAIGSATYKLSI